MIPAPEERVRRQRTLRAVTAALVVAATAVGCASDPPPPAAPPPSPPKPAPAAYVSPLSGLPADPTAPVFAVKVDNTAKGRPWDGVENADVVYVEPVEGGLTRLNAVFSSRLPPSVGPVRSARESDVDVLSAYGQPALVYSGSAAAIVPVVTRAPLVSTVPQDAPDAFHRNDGRPAPENLYVDLQKLHAETPEAAPAHDIGFRFGPTPPAGNPITRRDVNFPAAHVTLTWAQDRRWAIAMDGRPVTFGRNTPMEADTVLVQQVTTRNSAVHDVAGSVSPVAVTTGGGGGEILRDGRSYPIRWSRPGPTDPVRITTPDGKDLAMAPGKVWVLLAPTG